jgi:isopenicillin N synthase-like dioxygenase
MFLAIQVIYLLMIFYSSDGQNIPIIDISEFVNGSDMARREIANKMGDACKKVGFFIIQGYQIDKSIIDNMCMSYFNNLYRYNF